MTARGIDPVLVAGYEAQAVLVGDWLAGLSDADLQRPSLLPGWRVAELVAHLAASGSTFTAASPAPRTVRPSTIAAYVAGYGPAAGEITDRATAAAQDLTAATATGRFAQSTAAVRAAVDQLDGDPVLAARRGPIRASDLLRTRVLELVVHSLDADPGPARDRQAVRVCVRLLAAAAAERHPGRGIEVRVPPYAAVQLGAGPTHTRGTPPNVVECAPETFVAVATGRRSWPDAVTAGEVRASGSRADLAPYLPVM